MKSAERYRNLCKQDESCPEVDDVSYRSGVYKMYMVRMAGMPDELANVRVYKFDVQKCAYPVMGCL